MVKIFCLAPVADVANFGHKGQRSRSEGPVEVSKRRWFSSDCDR